MSTLASPSSHVGKVQLVKYRPATAGSPSFPPSLQGWQLLIFSTNECLTAVLKGQQQPHQHFTNAHPGRGQSSQQPSSGHFAPLAAVQGLSVQLHATEIVAELVANTSQGGAVLCC